MKPPDALKIVQNPLFLALPCALRITNPFYYSLPQATFHGSTQKAWQAWSKSIFKEVLYPVLQKSIPFAACGHVRELLDLNHQISGLLRGTLQRSSLASGRHLLLSLTAPRGDKVLEKLIRHLQAHPAEGCHLAVAYAARCTAFHFAPPLCISSYLYQEAWIPFHSSGDLKLLEYVAIAYREAEQKGSPLPLRTANM